MALVVRGAVKDYDWGIVDGLAEWTGVHTEGPQAELWFGVHPGGPSPLLDVEGEETGEHLGDKFDVTAIPLLVKLLAAARPLSVQVHPDSETAARMYELQTEPGAKRVLSDPFEKTEMLIALDHFEAFSGWRDRAQAIAVLRGIDGTDEVIAMLEAGHIADALVVLRELSTADRIAQLPSAAKAAGLGPEQVAAYETVLEQYPDDPGALLTVLLDYLALEPGNAVYVPAGVPHSYIRGTGVEVMTSSDNVIRLGLTGKPVYVDRAIEALRMDQEPQVVRSAHGDILWPVNAPFVVRMLTEGSERIPAGAYRILLAIEGRTTVVSELGDIALRPGTAAVLGADDADAYVEVDGLVAVVQSTER